jgi:hypothetical protein
MDIKRNVCPEEIFYGRWHSPSGDSTVVAFFTDALASPFFGPRRMSPARLRQPPLKHLIGHTFLVAVIVVLLAGCARQSEAQVEFALGTICRVNLYEGERRLANALVESACAATPALKLSIFIVIL